MSVLNGALILLADDEQYITSTVSARLKKEGATVLVASDGADAYALACDNSPQLIVTDYQMPQMSGIELCQRLKTTPLTSHIPIIMLTAKAFRLPQDQLNLTNIRVLLAKPFSIRDILTSLEQLLVAQRAGTMTAIADTKAV